MDRETLQKFGFSDSLLLDEMLQYGKQRLVTEGTYVADPGTPVDFVPLIIKGTLRVTRVDSENEKELFLYYLTSGTACSSTIGCCMETHSIRVEVVAEEDSELFVLPLRHTLRWFEEYSDWRRFVLMSYQARFEEALQALDSVAFRQLDERLLTFLRERSSALGTSEIPLSHGDIAVALHSSREVISRLLKKMEGEGLVILGRNRIVLSKG